MLGLASELSSHYLKVNAIENDIKLHSVDKPSVSVNMKCYHTLYSKGIWTII